MNDHMQLQPIVDVAPDGLTAHSRSRELDLLGHVGGQGSGWRACTRTPS